MTARTDREIWADSPPRDLFSWSITNSHRAKDIAAGLRALAATWFDDYTDETDLPSWFHAAVEYAESQHDLDLPTLFADLEEEDDE